jgi:hypothetical protein
MYSVLKRFKLASTLWMMSLFDNRVPILPSLRSQEISSLRPATFVARITFFRSRFCIQSPMILSAAPKVSAHDGAG